MCQERGTIKEQNKLEWKTITVVKETEGCDTVTFQHTCYAVALQGHKLTTYLDFHGIVPRGQGGNSKEIGLKKYLLVLSLLAVSTSKSPN